MSKQRATLALVERLGVRGGEEPLTRLVSAFFFLVQASHGIGTNAADALFFVRFGVEFLPLMILISGFAVMAGLLAATGWGGRGAPWPIPLAFAGWLVLERLGVEAGIPGIYPVVWEANQVTVMVTFTLMWSVASEVTTARQAKRLFPLFASAGIAGGVVGNALTGPAAALLGAEDLLLVQAGLLAAAALLARRIATRFYTRPPDTGSPSGELIRAARLTWRTPILRLVSGTAVAFGALFFLVVFPFSQAATASFPDEEALAAFLGTFSAIATAVTFAVSLLAAGRLLSRLGVVVSLMIVPLVYTAGFSLWLLSFGLATATLVRGAQWVAVNGIGGTAWGSLFNVLPLRQRSLAMGFVAAVPSQAGTVISGALLLLGTNLAVAGQAIVGLVLALAALLLVARMRPEYVSALMNAVRSGVVEVFGGPAPGIGPARLCAEARQALEVGMADPRPGRREAAVRMLGRLEDAEVVPLAVAALDDPAPEVRMAALDALGGRGHRLEAQHLLADPDPDVRRRALQVAGGDGIPRQLVHALLDDPDPLVRATAAQMAGVERARETIGALLASERPALVTAGLSALGDLPVPGIDIERFASHPDTEVRIAAAPLLARSDAGLTLLRDLLEDVSPRVRRSAAVALAGRADTAPVLLEVLRSGSVRASEAALAALTETPRGFEETREWAESELERALHLRQWRSRLTPEASDPAGWYLRRVLAARQHRIERWVLRAIATDAGLPDLPLLNRGVWSDDPQVRSQALEALEASADRRLAGRLVDLLESGAEPAVTDSRDALREMSEDWDRWISSLAVRVLAEHLVSDAARLGRLADAQDLNRGELPTIHASGGGRGLGIVDRVIALARVSIFEELDPEELELVARISEERRFARGETVYRTGDDGSEMLVLVEGSVEVLTGAEKRVLATRRAGDHVGELAVLRSQPRMADVVGGPEGGRGLAVPGPDLRSLLLDHPGMAMAMMTNLADRISEIG